jgi:hypothetical protein
MEFSKLKWWPLVAFGRSLDQLQLVPSGGDSGRRRDQHGKNIFCHDIRVQLREIKCMELVSYS